MTRGVPLSISQWKTSAFHGLLFLSRLRNESVRTRKRARMPVVSRSCTFAGLSAWNGTENISISLHCYATKSAKQQDHQGRRYKSVDASRPLSLLPEGSSLSVSGRPLARHAPRTSASGFCDAQVSSLRSGPMLLAEIVFVKEDACYK